MLNRYLIIFSLWVSLLFAPTTTSSPKPAPKKFSLQKKSESFLHKKLTINLKNPSYSDGELSTKEGGVVEGENFRVQGKIINYIQKEKDKVLTHTISCENNLLLQWHNHVFTGEKFYYNFVTKTGVITQGKTVTSFCYISGEKIFLNSDGSYLIKNASLTTSENKNTPYALHLKEIKISKDAVLNSSFIKINLNKFRDTPVLKPYVAWDKSAGPKVGIRYQLFSREDFALYARAEYRKSFGFGGAIETEYLPTKSSTQFFTKNYLATDMVPNDPRKKRRYRIQGFFSTLSPSKKTEVEIIWDKFSDINMPNDFRTDDFEIEPAKKTQLYIFHKEPLYLTSLKIRPRVNLFESLRQDLPSVLFVSKPLCLPFLSIVNQNKLKFSYIDYVYSHNLIHPLSNQTGMRAQLSPSFYRSFYLGALHFTPLVQADGIIYSHTPKDNGAAFLGSLHYLLDTSIKFSRTYSKTFEHIFEPYVKCEGWTHPSLNLFKHFIYSIDDGYHFINELSFGVKNFFYDSQHKLKNSPNYFANLYVNAFLPKEAQRRVIPRLYADFEWNLPFLNFRIENGWNLIHKKYELFNAKAGITVNEDIAFQLEFRHRSKTCWRKSDPENFILDVTQPEKLLLNSPLSDRRNTFLTHFFFHLTPFWSCQIQSHHGWHRKNEKPYNEVKVDLHTTISSFWKIKLSYQHTEWDDRFSFGYELCKF